MFATMAPNSKTEYNYSVPFYWLISATEIGPGKSAIIGDNHFFFFAIHHAAIIVITLSLISSLVVIHNIHRQWKSAQSKLDFPIRFPLYLAITDLLWGISHFTDHMYLVTTQTYPTSSFVNSMLSINLWIFFGYQQLMHASVAVYTYLRVMHHIKVALGKWEWKLHLLWGCFLVATSGLMYILNAYGNSGYWMGNDTKTTTGLIAGVVLALTSTLNALCTTLCYCRIRCTVEKLTNNLEAYREPSSANDKAETETAKFPSEETPRQQSVASRCLTTYVWLAACLYIPLAILLWINVVFSICWTVVDPVSCLLIALVGNSSGWANAYGYFHNQRIKKRKKEEEYCRYNLKFSDNSGDSESSSRMA